MLEQSSEPPRPPSSIEILPTTPVEPAAAVMAEPPMPEPVRVTHDLRRLEAWALVLVSMGLHPLRIWHEGRFELHVPEHERDGAETELAAADAEELQTRRAAAADAALGNKPVTRHAVWGGLLVALMLLVFFGVTGPRAATSAWFSGGASDAERVLQGEWWRTVTALTLHADTAHVVSNVGIGALVVGAVMRSEGVGFGAALVLAAGATGNWINAWAHHALHSSVGFSTAVFGAIGILGGLGYVHARQRAHKLRPAWTALGGSLALLALLGSSERSDLFAHLFGGLAGIGLGLAVGFSGLRPRSTLGQWASGVGAAALVVGAWCVALGLPLPRVW
ncbi:MAG: rhomboid family intramembrane serine protease [Myxococcales bacterium]